MIEQLIQKLDNENGFYYTGYILGNIYWNRNIFLEYKIIGITAISNEEKEILEDLRCFFDLSMPIIDIPRVITRGKIALGGLYIYDKQFYQNIDRLFKSIDTSPYIAYFLQGYFEICGKSYSDRIVLSGDKIVLMYLKSYWKTWG